jgi:hypothetical protein
MALRANPNEYSINAASKVSEPPVNVDNTLDGAKVRAISDNSAASTAVGEHFRLLPEIPDGMRVLTLSGTAGWDVGYEDSDGVFQSVGLGAELPKGEILALENGSAGVIAAEDIVLTYVAHNS